MLGTYSLLRLSFEQYPFLAPPTIRVTATYPGASALAVEQSVATPIEQEVNGVDRMVYMKSSNTSDGRMQLDVNFEVGVDQDTANVLTQNRVSTAQARLPQEVVQQGVTVKKQSPSILMLISLYSPAGSYDANYLINYASINIRDQILRIPGIAQADLFGGTEYGLRIWLRPDKLAKLAMTPADVISAIKEQNLQAPAGRIGASPAPPDQAFTFTVSAPGRLVTTQEFENIILRTATGTAAPVRIKDVGRAELGSQDYNSFGRLDGKPSGAMAVYLLPGANQLKASEAIYETMKHAKGLFPPDLDYKIVYDTTPAVEASIHEIVKTFVEALILVTLVVFIFLQNVRATIIPLLTVPVSIVGTFIFFPLLGFSVNTLSMFGLVLAIGIGVARLLIRRAVVTILLVGVVVVGVGLLGRRIPAGFIPDEDQGLFGVAVQLPPAASLERTSAMLRKVEEILAKVEAVDSYQTIGGYGAVTSTYQPNFGSIFVRLKPWEERHEEALHVKGIMARVNRELVQIPEAVAFPFNIPTISGFGAAAGFNFLLQDRSGSPTVDQLGAQTRAFLAAARQRPEFASLFTAFDPTYPQVKVELDREQARTLGVPVSDVFQAMSAAMGGTYVNDFNPFGRLYRVYVQADADYRRKPGDIGDVYVRSKTTSTMIPLSTLVTITTVQGTELTTRFNLLRSVEING